MEKQIYLIPTSSKLLETYSPKGLRTVFRGVVSVTDALAAGEPCLCALATHVGSEKVLALLKLQLIELNDLLNLKRPLTEASIDAIAEAVLEEFKALTMADCYLILRRAKTGAYGEFYESINMPKILTWFRNYFEERCEAAEERSIEQAKHLRIQHTERSSAPIDLKTHIKRIGK